VGAQKLLTGHDASASLRHHQMAPGRNGMDGGSSESTAEEEDNEVGVCKDVTTPVHILALYM